MEKEISETNLLSFDSKEFQKNSNVVPLEMRKLVEETNRLLNESFKSEKKE